VLSFFFISNIGLKYDFQLFSSSNRASYCVVAACDVNDDHTDVALSTDDYLWIKLCQLKEDELAGNDTSHDRVTYSQFQTLVLEEYGLCLKNLLNYSNEIA